ncbi:MAG: DUF4258 domain-containing protein [Chloroflexota bacterium]
MKYRRVILSQHAFTRMFEREISPAVVKRAVQNGEVIENYPDDQPYPSILLLHFEEGRALHIVAGVDEAGLTCHIVTAYWPDPNLWNADFRTRRKK